MTSIHTNPLRCIAVIHMCVLVGEQSARSLHLQKQFITNSKQVMLMRWENHIVFTSMAGICFQLITAILVWREHSVSLLKVCDLRRVTCFIEYSRALFEAHWSFVYTLHVCLPLAAIIYHYNIQYHINVDDTQLYCYFNLKSPFEVLNDI